ncbi:hypothetical protein E2C01_024778 [Portunus trituberculatus]|uniref:Secreted protein n=1 Tax=Portunus trituberculatus TaxID=210409 RepID=A0A5B7EDB1_PORTR|nr:hypothetical protein [Portunus trituberculatus]
MGWSWLTLSGVWFQIAVHANTFATALPPTRSLKVNSFPSTLRPASLLTRFPTLYSEIPVKPSTLE